MLFNKKSKEKQRARADFRGKSLNGMKLIRIFAGSKGKYHTKLYNQNTLQNEKTQFQCRASILPREVIEDTAKAILDFNGIGLSLMEISHRSKDFQPVVDEAVALFKEILNIPDGYSVIFLGGGASLEFCMVPYNFLEKKAAYLNTGTWAKKAMKKPKRLAR